MCVCGGGAGGGVTWGYLPVVRNVKYCKRRNFRAVHIFAYFAQVFKCAKM